MKKRFILYLLGILFVFGVSTVKAQTYVQIDDTDGLIVIGAENYSSYYDGDGTKVTGISWDKESSLAGFYGTGYLVSDMSSGDGSTSNALLNPYMQYDMSFVKTGTHKVWIRWCTFAWDGSSGHSSMHVSRDGETPWMIKQDSNHSVWKWYSFDWDITGASHNLKVLQREPGVYVDQIVISSNASFDPSTGSSWFDYTDATLSDLSVTDYSISPDFSKSTQSYSVIVPEGTTSVTINATENNANASSTGNGTIAIATPATKSVVVTAEDGVTQETYSITFSSMSTDATLSDLSVTDYTLSPVFSSETEDYTVLIPDGTSTVEILGTKNDDAATITSGTGTISISGDDQVKEVLVTAEDGSTTKTYSITFKYIKYFVIPAESYDDYRAGTDSKDGDAWVNEKIVSGYNGAGYMRSEMASGDGDIGNAQTVNAMLSYSVPFSSTGSYNYWVRVQYPSDGHKSMFLGYNSAVIDRIYSYTYNEWIWQSKSLSISTLDGSTKINIMQREPDAIVDMILVTNDLSYDPSSDNSEWLPTVTTVTNGETLNITTNTTYNDLTIESGGVVNVDPGVTLTISGALNNENGATGLVLNSDATGTAMLSTTTNGVEATVEQYFTRDRWQYFGLPTNAAVNVESVLEDVYVYRIDETTATTGDNGETGWVNIKAGDQLVPGVGYAVLNYGDWDATAYRTFTFTGTLNTGDISPTISKNGAGWNLISNPYPISLDLNSISKTNLNASIYVYNNGTYGSWNGTVGTNDQTQYIAPMQAFFVLANATDATMSLNNTAKATQTVLFKNAVVNSYAKIALTDNEGRFDETILLQNATSSTQFDGEFDAYKLIAADSKVPQIYTESDVKYSINTMPSFKESELISLKILAKQDGVHTLSASLENLPANTPLILLDSKKNKLADLSVENYKINLAAGSTTDLFIATNYMASKAKSFNLNNIQLTADHQLLSISGLELNSQIDVYNMAGQKIASMKANNGKAQIQIHCNGIFIVKAHNENGFRYNSKIVIK